MTGRAADPGVRISLSAVIMTLRQGRLCVLTTGSKDEPALPSGPFDPIQDRTFELALRAFVEAQTRFRTGFVEQLYTFGDAGRTAPRATPGPDRAREVSVGYLALTREGQGAGPDGAQWIPVFDILPWEDRRIPSGAPASAIADLAASDGRDPGQSARLAALFPAEGRWNEERVLDRYELLYELGLVPEAARDHGTEPGFTVPGQAMASDHRRILATGLGRLRSKLKYRPVLFELAPETFTLSVLQSAAEAVAGLALHKQNFRRGVERAGLVKPTGRLSTGTGGRPAELFRACLSSPHDGRATGLALPSLR